MEKINSDIVTDDLGDIRLYNGDCMEWMKRVPDKYYELAIVDPPYGLDKKSVHGKGKLKDKFLNRGNMEKWDVRPTQDYFDELFRVSKRQIIWGANYFSLPPTRCIVCWDKQQVWENFSQCEIAWTSYDKPAKLVTIPNRGGHSDLDKFHPTQKPIRLYEWLLCKFAKKGDLIFDSHFGSLSIGIACHKLGYQLDACELDSEYYQNALDRLKDFRRQKSLFEVPSVKQDNYKQSNLF